MTVGASATRWRDAAYGGKIASANKPSQTRRSVMTAQMIAVGHSAHGRDAAVRRATRVAMAIAFLASMVGLFV
jgi:hypothetical protein